MNDWPHLPKARCWEQVKELPGGGASVQLLPLPVAAAAPEEEVLSVDCSACVGLALLAEEDTVLPPPLVQGLY